VSACTSLGFVVTETERTPEPVCPDPFITALEHRMDADDAPSCRRVEMRLGLARDADEHRG
jgi:hypothetical protein